ncbi:MULTISPECIES: hemolysin family protein [unclassified Paenibacillus]|uniref:hemolysin family protein n=1 Tax=unclassified Paenibacillus TaxID=185978 RepID=UPI001AE28ED1|nr:MULTISPECIES: hemolysin family protein [unclassified Paenibacillus]MBP1157149.1 CBS domain containing-hemolysin-like protein [Paenibacillus sp. PvP091]MBP1172112.1 CBS domain containing-hemolysin-like protein [Paenibacillus sp. PvR098]MBP2438493.1 CBS domain containing-hemolysin-like protein [Paenibacillus sp. PvP052]
MITLNLLLIVVLILGTALFVATEFAIVKLRPSRVNQMVAEGRKNALAVQKVTSNLDGYLSACQLGITVTALGLGWLGKPTVEKLLNPLLAGLLPADVVSFISFITAFSLITFLHVVVGELAPKSLAIQKAEMVSSICAPPMIFFYKIMYPFIWVLNGSANKLIRLFGLRPAKEHEEAHTEEELRIILSESYKSGNINQSEYGYVNRIFEFDQMLAREIMVPRTDMVCLDVQNTPEQNMTIIKEEQFTRFPVIDTEKDNVIGFINTKQLFLKRSDHPEIELSQLLQPVLSVSEATPIQKLLMLMQKQQNHMVILHDEYGGTSGLITIEDILEEIVGEIQDEFDAEEKPDVEIINNEHIIVDGKVPLSTVSELLHVPFEDEDFDTIGGWLYNQNTTLKKGSKWVFNDLTFVVKERDRNRIRKVEIIKSPAPAPVVSEE